MTDSGVKLSLRTRQQTYLVLSGIAVGSLLAGLALPFVWGERQSDSSLAVAAEPTTFDSEPSTVGAPETLSGPSTSPGESAAPGDPVDPGGGGESAEDRGASEPPGSPGAAPGTSEQPTPTGGAAANREPLEIGILILDVGSLGTVGIGVPGAEADEQRRAWDAYIGHLNARGGVNGRQVTPVYRSYDVFNEDDMRAACLALTEDARVFVALDAGGFTGPPVLCFTEEHQTPLIFTGGQGIPDVWFRRSGGRLFSVFQAGGRQQRNFVFELERMGVLEGKTIGILADGGGGAKATADVLQQSLEDERHPVAHREDLPSDPSSGAGRIPVAVQQMRTKGVDVVTFLTSVLYASQFVQEADSQRYYPRYYTSDWGSGATDVYHQSMPLSYAGARVITVTRVGEQRAGRPEPPYDRECRAIYEQTTGRTMERGQNQYGLYVRQCTLLRLFEAAATRAGPDLTPESFTAALQQLGEFPLGFTPGGSFRPGKGDAADFVQTLEWQSGCRCLVPVEEFRRSRY